MNKPQFIYVTYIASTPDKVWQALRDPELTRQYWYHRNISDWQPGSRWEHRRCDEASTLDMEGVVLEADAPRRMVLSWFAPGNAGNADKTSRVVFDIEPLEHLVKLTVTHSELEAESPMLKGISWGWPVVLSSLKSILETGEALPLWWLEKGKGGC